MAKNKISLENPTPKQAALFHRLDALGINHITTPHDPVATVDESRALRGAIPGDHCKSLFLKTKKGEYFLAIVHEDRRVNLSNLAKYLDVKRLSFARPERLEEILGVTPGSVTPFALMNDAQCQVKPLIDHDLLNPDQINFHPLKNDATTTIKPNDLLKFIEDCGHSPAIIDFSALT